MKATLCALALLVAGALASAQTKSATAPESLPIGSLDAILQYSTNEADIIWVSVSKDYPNYPDGSWELFGKHWWQVYASESIPYDHDRPLGDAVKEFASYKLNQAAPYLASLDTNAPTEQWFLTTVWVESLQGRTGIQPIATEFSTLQQFQLTQSGTEFLVPDSASDPVFVHPPGWLYSLNEVTNAVRATLTAITPSGPVSYDSLDYTNSGPLVVNPYGLEHVAMPYDIATGGYAGIITLYFSEDNSDYAQYDLSTGQRVVPGVLSLALTRTDAVTCRLDVKGGNPFGTLVVEASYGDKLADWNTVFYGNYSGWTTLSVTNGAIDWGSFTVEPAPRQFFRAKLVP